MDTTETSTSSFCPPPASSTSTLLTIPLDPASTSGIDTNYNQVLTEIKSSFPLWEELLFKTGKLQLSLKSTLMFFGSFLETYQKLADIASGTRGGYSNDLGVGLTRLALKHRNIEDKLKSFIVLLSEMWLCPLQEKIDEWKKTIFLLDKERNKECKKAQQEVKKAAGETTKLKKKMKKSNKGDVQAQVEQAVHEQQDRQKTLEHVHKSFLRSVVNFSRNQFVSLIGSFKPLADVEFSLVTELMSINEITNHLVKATALSPPLQSVLSIPPNTFPSPPPPTDTTPSPDKGSYQDLFPIQVLKSIERNSSTSSASTSPQHTCMTSSQLLPLPALPKLEELKLNEQQQLQQQQTQKQKQIQQQQQSLRFCSHHHHNHHNKYQNQPSSQEFNQQQKQKHIQQQIPPSLLNHQTSSQNTIPQMFSLPQCSCKNHTNHYIESITQSNNFDSSIKDTNISIINEGNINNKINNLCKNKNSGYTKLFYAEEKGTSTQDNQLEGYVKMNQLASMAVMQDSSEMWMRKMLACKAKTDDDASIKYGPSSFVEEFEATKQQQKLQSQQSFPGQQQKRSNLRDRSLPPTSRKSRQLKVQFASHHSPQQQFSQPQQHCSVLQQHQSRRMMDKNFILTKSESFSNSLQHQLKEQPQQLPPFPPLEMLKSSQWIEGDDDDAELPLPPMPEELMKIL